MKRVLKILKSLIWPTPENKYLPYCLSTTALGIYLFLFFLIKIILGWQIIAWQKTTLFADLSIQSIIKITNEERLKQGLPPLQENPLLTQAAKEKALDMIKQNYFSHFSPSGTSPWNWITKNGYQYHYAGENLAINFWDSEELVNAWLNSTGHRENLLNPNYKDIGVAIISDKLDNTNETKTIVVQMFASPSAPKKITTPATTLAVKPKPKINLPTQTEEETNITSSPTSTITSSLPAPETALNLPKTIEAALNQPTNLPLNLEIAANKPLVKTIDRLFSYGIFFIGLLGLTGISVNSLNPRRRQTGYFVNIAVILIIIIASLILKTEGVGGILEIL